MTEEKVQPLPTDRRRVGRVLLVLIVVFGFALLASAAPAAAASGTIKGHVTDNNGGNLAGICVTARSAGGASGIGFSGTDSVGNYTVQSLSTGPYKVSFGGSCPFGGGGNWAPQWFSNKADFNSADQVSVADGQDTTGINAQLQPGGTIKGHMTDNNGGNLAGICVRAQQAGGSSEAREGSTATDASGNYTIQALGTGSYTVTFSGAGGCGGGNWLTQSYNNKDPFSSPDQVSVTAGQDSSGINAQMQPGGRITGHVNDNNGANLAGICVLAGSGHVLTDAGGNYSILALRTGSYQVQFTPMSGQCSIFLPGGNWLDQWYNNKPDFGSADAVAVTAGQDTVGINAQMQPGGTIKGHVTDNNGGDLAGICVTARSNSGTTNSSGNYPMQPTDSNGNYTIQRLSTSSYKVQFAACPSFPGGTMTNWATQWYNNRPVSSSADPVPVTAGQDATGINAQMQPGGTIKGHVTDNQGRSLAGVCVGVDPSQTFTSASTDVYTNSSGDYAIQRLAGSYRVQFATSGCPFASFANFATQWYNNKPVAALADVVSVTPGQDTTSINAQMQPPGGTTTGPPPGPPAGSSSGISTGPSVGPSTGTSSGASPEAATAVASAISLSSIAFASEDSGPSATSAKRKGTTVSFKLDRAATAIFTVQRPADGRKVKHGNTSSCDRPTKRNRIKKKCTRYIRLKGSFNRAGVAGQNKFHFTGRLNGKKLSPGKYRLMATPRIGQTAGIATTTTFRIVP